MISKQQPKHYDEQLYSKEKNGLQQFQMESCQPIKRLKDKKKKFKGVSEIRLPAKAIRKAVCTQFFFR
jgi:hypothetical protein